MSEQIRGGRYILGIVLLSALMLIATIFAAVYASDYTRDGGTANFMCCEDKACTTIVSQHTDVVYARDACGALTDADGKTRWVRSQAFRVTSTAAPAPTPTPTTASATLSWVPPTTNLDGSALAKCAATTDTGPCLAKYRICRGTTADALTDCRTLNVPAATGSQWTGLTSGTHWFGVKAVNGDGIESPLSNTASKVVP